MAKKSKPSTKPKRAAKTQMAQQENNMFLVSGRVIDRETGEGIAGLRVEAFDKDLRNDEPLGSATTNDQGRYEIPYSAEQFSQAEKKSADLIIRVFDAEDRLLGESAVIINAPAEMIMEDLPVDLRRESELSEYETYLAEITPLLQDIPIHELQEEHFTFLAGETAIERERIVFLSRAAGLSRETDIQAEVFYGFARRGLPLELPALRRQSLEEMRAALEAAIEENIIPARLRDSLDQIMEQLRRLKTEQIPIVELAESVGLRLPAALLDFFSAKNIRTLVDIRNVGGIGHLEGLPVPPDDPAVKALEAHADLMRLSYDLHLNRALIEKGFTSVSAIAAVSRTNFVATAADGLGDFKAAQLHTIAKAQTHFLQNVFLSFQVGAANGAQPAFDGVSQRLIQNTFPMQCGCPDCDAAVSPLAYLADLLGYALDHLKNGNAQIDLNFLVTAFHQPFHALPATCQAMDRQVRQVRLCIEVLRGYLKAHPPSADQRGALAKAEQTNLQEAYATLLTQLGTSYEEIRTVVRSADRAARQELADRLGIDLDGATPDNLSQLFLDPSPNAPASTRLTEQTLERLFGLSDTTRDPLASAAVPELQKWRVERLYRLWREQDWLTDPYSNRLLPVIDPNLIGEYDLRNVSSGSDTLRIWQERRTWVTSRLTDMAALQKNVGGRQVPDLQAMLTSMLQPFTYNSGGSVTITPWADTDIRPVYDNLAQGIDLEATRQTIEQDYGLTVESLTRLVEIMDKDSAVANDPTKEAVTDGEWEEARAILVQAQKVKLFTFWINEEPARDVRSLNPRDFWISLQEPTLPKWLASAEVRLQWQAALRGRSATPLIDPDQIELEDLRNPMAGNPVYDLWLDRKNTIESYLQSLKNQFVNFRDLPNFDAAVVSTLRIHRADELENLAKLQAQGQTIKLRLAQLTLDPDAFAYLVRARRLLASGASLLDAEWEAVFAILTQVEKRRSFALWRDQERDAGIILTPDFFKPRESDLDRFPPPPGPILPEWRASTRARREWEETLTARIKQLEDVSIGLAEVVSAVEEITMPALRDALILASDAPAGTPVTKAKWIADHLLIDTQTSGCHTTTRIAQAIETIQGLLFSVRSGLLRDTYPDLALDADDFDSEWKWIGSYVTWRAAMFVFLYPENVLQPSLRKGNLPTPVFSRWVSDLRDMRRLTPQDARKVAAKYADYFEDICNLYVEATCHTDTHISPTRRISAFHMFARGGKTGAVYWSFVELDAALPDYAQSYWTPLRPEDSVQTKKIIGAVPYTTNARERYLYLFAQILEKGTEKLGFYRYNLNQGGNWESFKELDLPKGGTVSAVVLAQGSGENGPPCLALRTSDTKLHVRVLNLAGTDWEGDDFDWDGAQEQELRKELLRLLRQETLHPLSLLREDYGFCLFGQVEAKLYAYFFDFVPKVPGGSRIHHAVDLGRLGQWQGAFILNVPGTGGTDYGDFSSRRIYAFWSDGVQPQHRWFAIPLDPRNVDISQPQFPGLLGYNGGFVVPHGGGNDAREDQTGRKIIVSFRPTGAAKGRFVRSEVRGFSVGSSLSEEGRADIAPRATFTGMFNLTDQLTTSERQQRATAIEYTLADNAGAPRSFLTYIEEAHYFVPIHLALQLQSRGQYLTALDWFRTVYDYTAPFFDSDGNSLKERKIYYGLVQEESLSELFKRAENWLLDPLNPHRIAATRANSYTRYTLISIVSCLLDFADALFTQDTSETLPQARLLYMTALELLDLPELNQRLNLCTDLIGRLDIQVGFPQLRFEVHQLQIELKHVRNYLKMAQIVSEAERILAGNAPLDERLAELQELRARARAENQVERAFQDVLAESGARIHQAHAVLSSQPTIVRATEHVGVAAGEDFLHAVTHVANVPAGTLVAEPVALPWLREPLSTTRRMNGQDLRPTNVNLGNNPEFDWRAGTKSFEALKWIKQVSSEHILNRSYGFCIPPNPLLRSLRLRPEINLYKLRNCLNIAGMERQVDPYAAPIDTTSGLPSIGAGGQLLLPGLPQLRPTPYRYAVLVERAKHLVQLSQQVESALLQALEKRDYEAYTLMKARHDVSLAKAGVRLQDLRVTEAESGVQLAELQKERAEIQANHWQTLLEQGETGSERSVIDFMQAALLLHAGAATASAVAAGAYAFAAANPDLRDSAGARASFIAQASSAGAGMFSSLAAAASTRASMLSILASYQRRRQDWEFQQKVALQDMSIGLQQVKIANDHVRVVGQERAIAEMQVKNTEAIVNYLDTKFTNVELYDWMIGILERIFSYFLQQATAMAQLAANQLAFERQEVPPALIQANYWETPADSVEESSEDNQTERRGLTGSVRLLEDLYRLDQYAFETDKRKLQLSKTISLARLDPYAFQRFRDTGVLIFATPAELFDRDFPGHYLRLIKRVRTTVVALIPPTQGIRATLSTVGRSATVIGGNVFQTVNITRPDSVALSSPFNATGLFELDAQPEMLVPFEGMGVDTTWELRLPKAANLFDYNTIADVLVTIDYTALNSFEYRQQLIQRLDIKVSADRPFSFRHDFADQWYDLHNPEQTPTPMVVHFKTRANDFPPNIESLKIDHIALYFVRAEGAQFEVKVTHLHFTEQGTNGSTGGQATSADGAISTRRGNGEAWKAIADKRKSPFGEWELSLKSTNPVEEEALRNRFKNEEIEDILFVITYSGRIPEWPA